MKKKDLSVGMRVALGTRQYGKIQLSSMHFAEKAKVFVRSIDPLVLEAKAKWLKCRPDLTLVEGPLETRTFEKSGRDILGPWDKIAAELAVQTKSDNAEQGLRAKIKSELQRLNLKSEVLGPGFTIKRESFETFLKILTKVP